MKEKRAAYKTFFESKHGQEFLNTINSIIEGNHVKAEKYPENARDYAQRAKGNREPLDHINSVIAGGKTE